MSMKLQKVLGGITSKLGAYLSDSQATEPQASVEEPKGEPNPDMVLENENLMRRFHVYQDVNGKYQMEDGYGRAYEAMHLTAEQIQSGYEQALQLSVDGSPKGQVGPLSDIHMYKRVNDAEYLSSLSTAERTALMTEYLDWEKEHMYTYTDENGKTQTKPLFGYTVEEYEASDDKESIDSVMSKAEKAYDDAFGTSFAAYVKQPSVQAGAENPSTGFGGIWASMSGRLQNILSTARDFIGSTAVGAWVIDRLDTIISPGKSTQSEATAPKSKFNEDDFWFLMDDDGSKGSMTIQPGE